ICCRRAVVCSHSGWGWGGFTDAGLEDVISKCMEASVFWEIGLPSLPGLTSLLYQERGPGNRFSCVGLGKYVNCLFPLSVRGRELAGRPECRQRRLNCSARDCRSYRIPFSISIAAACAFLIETGEPMTRARTEWRRARKLLWMVVVAAL